MALRYLDSTQPQYVPSYTSINPQILAGVDQAVQQQGAQFQQRKRGVFDVAAGKVSQELSGLGDRDVQYAREQFERSRQNIRNIVEERGAREAMPFLEEEVSRVDQELSPLRQAAKIKQEATQQLSKNENLPTDVKQHILSTQIGGVYDEQGNLTEVKADINERDLSIGANWEDIGEYLQDFNSKARKANVQEGGFAPQEGGYTITSASGQQYDVRRIVESIGGDKLMRNNIEALMSDDKMREQLELLAKIKLQQDDPNITVNKNGEIQQTTYVPKTNSKGQYVDENNKPVQDYRQAGVEKKQLTYANGAIWQAAQKSKPYADRDSYYRNKYETRKVTGQKSPSDDMSESNFYTSKLSWKTPEMEANKYFKQLASKADKFERDNMLAMESLGELTQEFYKTDEEVNVAFENGVANLKVGNDSYTKSQVIQDFDERIEEAQNQADKNIITRQKQNMLNKLAILESNEMQANAFERQIKHVNNGVKNQLRDNEEINAYADLLNFGTDGSIGIDTDKLGKYLRNNRIQERGKQISEDEARVYEAQNMAQGEVREVRKHVRGREGWGPSEDTGFIIKRGDNIEYYSKDSGKIGRTISKAKQLQQKRVDDIRDAGEHKNVIGVALNDENDTHKDIIATIERQAISAESADGSITDSKGNVISSDDFSPETGDRFTPTKIAMVNGEAVVSGYVANSDGNPKEELRNLTLRGNMAQSFARDLYGADYHNVLSAESLKQFLPQLINDREDVNLSAETVNNMLNTNYSDDLTLKYKNTTDQYGDKDTFRIFHKGKEVWTANDPYDVVVGLLNYDQDLQAE